MIRRRLHALFAATFASLGCCAIAQAHPHLMIAQSVQFIVTDGQFTHVEIEWAFDPFSSDLEIAAIDDDKDGKLSAREERELANIALPELKRFDYLTWFNTGVLLRTGVAVPWVGGVDPQVYVRVGLPF